MDVLFVAGVYGWSCRADGPSPNASVTTTAAGAATVAVAATEIVAGTADVMIAVRRAVAHAAAAPIGAPDVGHAVRVAGTRRAVTANATNHAPCPRWSRRDAVSARRTRTEDHREKIEHHPRGPPAAAAGPYPLCFSTTTTTSSV